MQRMNSPDFYDDAIVRKAYTAKKLLDLTFLIQSQVVKVYTRNGMVFPVSCSSTLLHLSRSGPASVTEVASALRHPHQTVAQHLATLGKLRIVEKRSDAKDRRRTEYVLTEFGTTQAGLLHAYNVEAAAVFEGLDADIGCDLGELLDHAIAALNIRPMDDRFALPPFAGDPS